MDVEFAPVTSVEQPRDGLSPRLTIGQMLLPVIPFVVVFFAQSLLFIHASKRFEAQDVGSTGFRIWTIVDLRWRLGPCELYSTTTPTSSFIEQIIPTRLENKSSSRKEQLLEALSIYIDQAKSWITVCLFPFALIACIVIGRLSQWHSRVTVPIFRFYPPMKTVVVCTGILLALIFGVALMKSLWPPAVSELARHFGLRAGLLILIDMVIVAPVAEELVFRSFLCRILVERIGPVTGILLQALIFGSLHLTSPTHAAVAFTGGVVLGMVYVYTRSLGASIFLHATSNALLVGACLAIG